MKEAATQDKDAKNQARTVTIKAPNFQTAVFKIVGTSPLVIHRFSIKAKQGLNDKVNEGKSASSKKKRDAKSNKEMLDEARYIAPEGWDGFNANSIRNALVAVCRLVDFKMTLAKMSVFAIEDGRDKFEPQIPLIRIYGKMREQVDIGRVATGQSYIIVRPAYDDWHAFVKVRWDADQFTIDDVSNLMVRVGAQNGLGEGRYNSSGSCGMGWGAFEIQAHEQPKQVKAKVAA